MELIVGGIAVITLLAAAFFAGTKFGLAAAADLPNFVSADIARHHASDQSKMLDTWRREIANILVWNDPERYLNLYRSLHLEVKDYGAWKTQVLREKLDGLCEEYPIFTDFDPLGIRPHVLYADESASISIEEFEKRFADLTRYKAFRRWTDKSWGHVTATSETDLEHLTRYAGRLRDTKFLLRLERAMSDYNVWRAADHDEFIFEYGNVVIRPVSHIAERRHGIHFKDTNEFGLCCQFASDDGRSSISYYRSNNTFQDEGILDALVAVADAFRTPFSRLLHETESPE